ncbi:FMN phosphatase YigB (HAD superfamily) [Duganella sp. 1224]|uniref:HAD family hydrolase n=1 Tax=Duganella sp. 1224 TaxID=2587052 RepID=UPI0015C9B671|nr:HAD family hydrolase [Duganella sp. 1224]NYE63104.1 FMN phosphatase YigB (HAD superfamily) [Duganella sp. 1224]
MADDIVFLIDVDNTLLDNDGVQQDIRAYLERQFGVAGRDRYWDIYARRFAELGYADYLGAAQQFRLGALSDPDMLLLGEWLMDYPFAERLYPQALQVIGHLSQWGKVVVLSDGDAVFQPRKVRRAGIWDAVEGRVQIYVHKETMLTEIEQSCPARRYVMIDDKVRILAAMKQGWGERLTTVFPRQGHYAFAPDVASFTTPDATIERIGDLLDYDLPAFAGT